MRTQWRFAASAALSPTACTIVQGQLCLSAGTLLGPPELGILATVGATRVRVRPRPAVAVLSSGDEVVEPGCETLGPGQVRDSNRCMLVAAARDAGADVMDLGIAKDQARYHFHSVQPREAPGVLLPPLPLLDLLRHPCPC